MSCGTCQVQAGKALAPEVPPEMALARPGVGGRGTERCEHCGQFAGSGGHLCPLDGGLATRLGLDGRAVAGAWLGAPLGGDAALQERQVEKLRRLLGGEGLPDELEPGMRGAYAAVWNDVLAPKLYAERLAQAQGLLVGLACGDALGAPTEFMDYDAIRRTYGPDGIQELPDGGRYTDDTQMALATLYALQDAGQEDNETVQEEIARRYVEWYESPENTRAPGGTCLGACSRLAQGVSWRESGNPDSKGCGTAMRTAVIGAYYRDDPQKLYRVAYDSSATTHSHPAGIAGGVGVAYAAKLALDGVEPREWPGLVKEFCASVGSPDFDRAMDTLEEVAHLPPDRAMPRLGQGWVAEEAAALGMYCVMQHPDDFARAVRLGANARGRSDTDSIAAIAGALSGARLGIAAIPAAWRERVEKSAHLHGTAASALRESLLGDAIPEPGAGVQKCPTCGKFMAMVGPAHVCRACSPGETGRGRGPGIGGVELPGWDALDADWAGGDEPALDEVCPNCSGHGCHLCDYSGYAAGGEMARQMPLFATQPDDRRPDERYTRRAYARRNYVERGLAVGAAPGRWDVGELKEMGITAVLSLQEEGESPAPDEIRREFAWRRIPMRDSLYGGVPTVEWLAECVGQIEEWVRQGHRVYVHCQMGKGRSPAVCMAYLAGARRMRLARAIAQVCERHPGADPNVHTLGVLVDYLKGIVEPPRRSTPPWERGAEAAGMVAASQDTGGGGGGQQIPPLPDGDDLREWAASTAAGILRDNWQAAGGDGAPLAELARDVDLVVEHLQKWRAEVGRVSPQAVRGAGRSELERLIPLPPDADGDDLREWAAYEAAGILRDSWLDAIGDGTPLSTLIEDIDIVVEHLREWQAEVGPGAIKPQASIIGTKHI